MASSAIVQAARDILTAALAGLDPVPAIQLGKPERYSEPVHVWLQHRTSPDEFQTNDWVRRRHAISIGLLVQDETRSDATELAALDYHDAILGAFYSHKSLSGTVSTSELTQQDAPDWVYLDAAYYRARLYVLTAVEDVFPDFAD